MSILWCYLLLDQQHYLLSAHGILDHHRGAFDKMYLKDVRRLSAFGHATPTADYTIPSGDVKVNWNEVHVRPRMGLPVSVVNIFRLDLEQGDVADLGAAEGQS